MSCQFKWGYETPREFLEKENLSLLLKKSSSKLNEMEFRECYYCGSDADEGVFLLDNSFLCKECLYDISRIEYTENYLKELDQYRSEYLQYTGNKDGITQKIEELKKKKRNASPSEPTREAKILPPIYKKGPDTFKTLVVIMSFIMSAYYIHLLFNKPSVTIGILVILVIIISIYIFFVAQKNEAIMSFNKEQKRAYNDKKEREEEKFIIKRRAYQIEMEIISKRFNTEIRNLEVELNSLKKPLKPEMKSFDDPVNDYTEQDKKVLEIFNKWPNYPPFWDDLKEIVKKRDGGRCQVTGCISRTPLHCHHKIPKSEGGAHIPENLITLCTIHHAMEPGIGHDSIWDTFGISDQNNIYSVTMNDAGPGVRFRYNYDYKELYRLKDIFGFQCPACRADALKFYVDNKKKKVSVTCATCGVKWIGDRDPLEIVGAKMAQLLNVTRNHGTWRPLWKTRLTDRKAPFQQVGW